MGGWFRAAAQVVRDTLSAPRGIPLELQALEAHPAYQFDTAPRPIDQVISAMKAGTASVNRTSALSVPPVLRARNELCSIATLPMRLYRGLNVVDHPLFRQIDPETPNVVTMAQTIEDLVFEGVAWWKIIAQDFDGYPMAARFVSSERVSLQPPAGGAGQSRPSGDVAPADAGQWVWVDGVRTAAALMIRFDSPNPGLLRACGRSIRIALKYDALSEAYADNPRPLEEFGPSDDPNADDYSQDQVDEFLADYASMRRLGLPAWIPGAVKRSDVSAPSPQELQLAELKKAVILDIANATGLDPEDLGLSTTSRTYFNAQDRIISKINEGRKPIMTAITDRLSMGDVTRRGYAPAFDLTDYLAADPQSQATYWEALQRMGVTDAKEIRGWAKLPGTPPKAAAPTAPAAIDATAGPFRFAGQTTLTMDVRTTNFAADVEGRTITGLAVPYGQIASKGGLRFRFTAGSLEWNADHLGSVKHLRDHQTPVGFAKSITSTPDGLEVTMGVLPGAEGTTEKLIRDQLLADAEAGLFDGMSIGVDFDLDPEAGDAVYNEEDRVYDINRATLREVSTVALPAFVNARVTQVAAAREGGFTVDPCQHCGHRHDAGIACATFARQFAQPTEPTPQTPAPGGPGPAPTPPAPDARQFVGANSVALVREPAPYVFDRQGNLRAGSHDFSTDLAAGWREGGGGDQAAVDRAQTFLREQFAITPANVVNLNYPANRPEMYVDQMEYQYPLWDAINKGTLQAVTPFVIPKFNASSGLVADHVTGTEPTPGAFTATAQTITPSAVSGKVEITREAWDQGGNPQMSGLIWRQMTRGYFEALEAYAVAQIAALAASIADIVITTAAADSVLDQSIADGLIPLQYIRGGDRFRKVFTQIDLYKAMIKAKGTDGRRLYPALGPMNATGTTDPGYASIDAHGKLWIPAWATAATSVNAASSYMFDPEKVCGWASAPQRIDVTWRVAWVDLGIWGYKAFGVTDFAGIRELVYDPV